MNLESFHPKKKIILCMVMDIDRTYCGDHFMLYTNIESLYCTPEINILCQL